MEKTTVTLPNIELFKKQALAWANKFNVCLLLNSNEYQSNTPTHFEWTLAVDTVNLVEGKLGSAFVSLEGFLNEKKQTVFGFLSYDLKNEIENLPNSLPDYLGFPHLFFFEPRYVIEVKKSQVSINRNYPETMEIIDAIQAMKIENLQAVSLDFNFRTEREKYLKNVADIKSRILAGDFYEMNYCIELFAEKVTLNTTCFFNYLNDKTLAPFSSFVKYFDKFLLCASPERFLKRKGNSITSQPIKGTIKRSENRIENDKLQQALQQNEKERAENIMIVDLVRNDIAKSCQTGSVRVEELCGVYEFNTVNQMISTVSGTLKNDIKVSEIIRNTFPMGSMTGAPKIEVMKCIDALEDCQRNLYSGSVGYIMPNGDFDFNVVIRSVFYDAAKQYVSLRSGSAITFDSQAEKEWDEVLLKMKAMREIFKVGE